MLELAFRPDRDSAHSLAHQLVEHLAGLIVSGRLVAGTKLPASREAASALGLGRNTVTAAYEMLTARGLAVAHVGQGTFVSGAVGGTGISAANGHPTAAPRAFAWSGLFAAPLARVPEALLREARHPTVPFDFRAGRVEPGLLPVRELRWAFERAFSSRTQVHALAKHQDPYGWPPLRREIARRLVERGIACDAGDVAIVSGLQQAVDLAARALVGPSDVVGIEQPGYFGAALACAARGATLIGIDVDAQGIITERLARVLRVQRMKLLYVTPSTQSPTGASLSTERRQALRALADEHQVPIFEDDYDSDLRYAGPVVPALKADDPAGQVIHAGTFSKVLFPSLRLGYVVAARPVLERLVACRWVSDFGSGVVEQVAVATLLATGGLDRHLARLRRRHAERLSVLLDTLRQEMPPDISWTQPQSGHLVWVTLPPRIDPDRLYDAAYARGVTYTRGETFFFDGRGAHHLALAFTTLAPAAIAEGVRRLAALSKSPRRAHGKR